MGKLTKEIRWFFRKIGSRIHDPRKPRKIRNPEEVAKMIRDCELFKDVPEDLIAKMVEHMETVRRYAGDVIVREGDEGDYYYLLLQGAASVSRKDKDGVDRAVAELKDGEVFGEEALISYAKRNATVKMTRDGTLRRLPKKAFVDYVQDPLVSWMAPSEAQKRVNDGAKWLDVRDAEDYRRGHLPGALSAPLSALRDCLKKLDPETHYICVCGNSRMSATAAFIMKQRGYSASVLRGGLKRLHAR